MMTYHRYASVAVAIVAVVAGQLLLHSVQAVGSRGDALNSTSRTGASVEAQSDLSPCSSSITASLSAEAIRVCESVTVTLHTAARCPSRPVHFVFLMPEETYEPAWLRSAGRGTLDQLRALQDSGLPIRVGVVRYFGPTVDVGDFWPIESGAKVDVNLTDELGRAAGAVRRVSQGLSNMHDYVAGAREALRMLARARQDEPVRPSEFVAFFASSMGQHPFGPNYDNELLKAGRALQSDDVTILAVCIFDAVSLSGHHPCEAARRLADIRSRYSEQSLRRLEKMIDEELRPLIAGGGGPAVTGRTLTQVLPQRLSYIVGSASRPPTRREPAGSGARLIWALEAPTSTLPLTLTYRVEPTSEGLARIEGTVSLTDTLLLTRTTVMKPVTVTVSGLCLTPTLPPTPVPTPTMTPSPTATITPAPTATATPIPAPLYLPLALKEKCVPTEVHMDVALVVDASTSMQQQTAAGPTKLEAAREAVRLFLARMDPVEDQAAIIAFNATAVVLQSLTSDRRALEQALDNIEPARQTCLVCAVDAAVEELAAGRRGDGVVPVIVLLTDGKSNPRPASEAVDRATQAKADGIIIFTIGLGDDLDLEALAAMASKPEYFYRALDAEDLKEIYAEITVSIPCPGDYFWGRRP